MSESESEYVDNPIAFDGESSNDKHATIYEGAYAESIDSDAPAEVGSCAVVGADAGSTPPRASSSTRATDTCHHVEASTSGRGGQAVEVSTSYPREGFMRVVTEKERIPMTQPTGPMFSVDHLVPNILMEYELARIGYGSNQFNPKFWITLLGTITAFDVTKEGVLSYEHFVHLYSMSRVKSSDQGAGNQNHARLLRGTSLPHSKQLVGTGSLSLKRLSLSQADIDTIKRTEPIGEDEKLRREKEGEMAGGSDMFRTNKEKVVVSIAEVAPPTATVGMPLAELLKLKKADEATMTREAYLQVTGK
ncbi:unnamed protein product [Prunus armeniaca]